MSSLEIEAASLLMRGHMKEGTSHLCCLTLLIEEKAAYQSCQPSNRSLYMDIGNLGLAAQLLEFPNTFWISESERGGSSVNQRNQETDELKTPGSR